MLDYISLITLHSVEEATQYVLSRENIGARGKPRRTESASARYCI